MKERADDRDVALENSAMTNSQKEAEKQQVQIANKTTEFLGDAVQYGKAEIILKDTHPLWGGIDMHIYKSDGYDLWKADVLVVKQGQTFAYDTHFSNADIENLFALFAQEDFLSITLPQGHTAVPDESLISITLMNGRGEPFTVQKWQTQAHDGFDRLHQYLLQLEKKVSPI